MKILDLSNISFPKEINSYDTLGWYPVLYNLAIKDSFAYIGWIYLSLHSVNISDPKNLIPSGYVQ